MGLEGPLPLVLRFGVGLACTLMESQTDGVPWDRQMKLWPWPPTAQHINDGSVASCRCISSWSRGAHWLRMWTGLPSCSH